MLSAISGSCFQWFKSASRDMGKLYPQELIDAESRVFAKHPAKGRLCLHLGSFDRMLRKDFAIQIPFPLTENRNSFNI
jgi:hypothetical protein